MVQKIELHFEVTKDDDGFTAICHEFTGLVTCSAAFEALVETMIPDAISCWFDALRKLGKIDEALRPFGVTTSPEEAIFSPVLTGHGADVRIALRPS